MARHEGTRGRRLGRRHAVGLGIAAAIVAGVLAPGAANAATAAGCGFLGLQTCQAPANRTPGTPVTPLKQVNQSNNGGTNPKVGTVPSTSVIGTPNAGVVPVLGLASAKADDGAYVAYESRLDARTVDLMISSPAVGGAVPVRVQLPPDYASKPTAKFPTLYLLHGGNDKTDYQSWSLDTHEQQYTANLEALVVSPSIGAAAYATNYWNYFLGGSNQYDTFVATELPQLLQRGYRATTKADIAGISSGGYSAVALAFLHPGEYTAAATFSGLPDTELPVITQAIEYGALQDFQSPVAMWGDPIGQILIWSSRDPAANAAKLKGIKLFVSSGNGQVGPLDPAGASADQLEPLTQTSSQGFVTALGKAGVPVTTDFYGNGTHSWPYWDREFSKALPMLKSGLGIS